MGYAKPVAERGCSIRSAVCPVCGKLFYHHVSEWAYLARLKLYGEPKPVCSWSCCRKAQRAYEAGGKKSGRPRKGGA